MTEELLTFNGVNGATGGYLVPRMTADDLGRLALGYRIQEDELLSLQQKKLAAESDFQIRSDLDSNLLSDAGWGVIFPAGAGEKQVDAILEALDELLKHRSSQAGERYHVYRGTDGYQLGESKFDWLARHGAGPGTVDPDNVPYYLLIVSDPQSIPFEFQYELDVQYSVGRIHFATLDEYAQYARSVVACETGGVSLPRRAVFFGVANEDDRATQLSAENLVAPLAQYVQDKQARLGFEVGHVPPDLALKANLLDLLGGEQAPAFLFTASHGLGFPRDDPNQLPFQGALLCQDWPGPRSRSAPSRDHYLGGEDISDDKNLLGLIAFHFACFGGGTPYLDDYSARAFTSPSPLANHAFLSALPKRLLGHPRGGALAVVAHIERAWSYSFKWKQIKQQTETFESTLYRLMRGDTLGLALDDMNLRYADIAVPLTNLLQKQGKPDMAELAGLWTANNDARGYAIIGDPAVRLPVAGIGQAGGERSAIEAVPQRPGEVPLVLVSDSLPEAQFAQPAALQPAPVGAPAGFTVQPVTVVDGLAALNRYTSAEAESFGVSDTLRQVAESLTNALKNVTEKLSDFAKDVSGLEVTTYVGEDMKKVSFDVHAGRFSGDAEPRAMTHISLDGDTQVVVPLRVDQLDETLWAIHNDMVEQALSNRTAMIKAAAEVLAELLTPKAG